MHARWRQLLEGVAGGGGGAGGRGRWEEAGGRGLLREGGGGAGGSEALIACGPQGRRPGHTDKVDYQLIDKTSWLGQPTSRNTATDW